jgi:glycosyltransferase involved in cell wall biosynthesis
LARRLPFATFKVASNLPPSATERLADLGANVCDHLDRHTFLSSWLPSIDVLAYPSEFDGLPLTVLEAMAIGIPVATSDYRALPGMVVEGGLVSPVGDAIGLAVNLATPLEASANEHFGHLARERVNHNYSPQVVTARLRTAYDATLAAALERSTP